MNILNLLYLNFFLVIVGVFIIYCRDIGELLIRVNNLYVVSCYGWLRFRSGIKYEKFNFFEWFGVSFFLIIRDKEIECFVSVVWMIVRDGWK